MNNIDTETDPQDITTENNNTTVSTTNSSINMCPLCRVEMPSTDIFGHIFHQHPAFLIVWRSLTAPQNSPPFTPTSLVSTTLHNDDVTSTTNVIDAANTIDSTNANRTSIDGTSTDTNTYQTPQLNDTIFSNILNNTILRNLTNSQRSNHVYFDYFANNANNSMNVMNDIDDNNDYEYLLSLCERIGYYKVGVKDINVAAPIINADDLIIDLEVAANIRTNKCPICLEDFKDLFDTSSLRKIANCNHIYCAPCIETWFKNNRKCPVCKQYACNECFDESHTTNSPNNNTGNTTNNVDAHTYDDIPELIDIDDDSGLQDLPDLIDIDSEVDLDTFIDYNIDNLYTNYYANIFRNLLYID